MGIQKYLPAGKFWDAFLSIVNFRVRLGYFPRLSSPRSFNEFFLKEKVSFSGDINLSRQLTDKVEFKKWLKNNNLHEIIISTYKVAECIEDLHDYRLPTNCVVKPTHSSGRVILRRESNEVRFSEGEISILKIWLNENYYLRGREPNYYGIKPGIIVEELLLDSNGEPPADFKFFCVRGKPVFIQVDLDRFSQHTRQLYTLDWELMPFSMYYPPNPRPIEKPKQLSSALSIASIISRDIPLCRVDLYLFGKNEIRAGEVTFFPGNCAERFAPEVGDFELGKIISSQLNNSNAG